MKKRSMLLLLVLIIAAAGTVFANDSTLQVGVAAYTNWMDLEQGNFDDAQYGVRAQLSLSDLFAVSVDAIYQQTMYYDYRTGWYGTTWYGPMPWSAVTNTRHYTQSSYPYKHEEFVIITDLVAKLPMGVLEPYAGIGPSFYVFVPSEDGYGVDEDRFADYVESRTDTMALGYNVRAGLDLVLNDWFFIGAEVNFLENDLTAFYDEISSLETQAEWRNYVYENSTVGLTAKIRL